MSFLGLFPGIATASAAQFRVMALGNDADPTLQALDGTPLKLDWEQVTLDNGITVRSGTAVADHLSPDSEIVVRALEGGNEVQRATARTLPNELGGIESELRVLLASCYCRLNPSARGASDLFRDLFRAYGTPHLKIWCGDQVYLDSPAKEFLFKWNQTPKEIADNHLAHYERTWSREYLADPLARGANVFTPDDHEYWNNAPYPNVVVPGLYNDNRRKAWTRTATQLLAAFQGVPKCLTGTIAVPPVSILVLDTRSNRTPEGQRKIFMTDASMSQLRNWAQSLEDTGPGLLVIGQPVFAAASDKVLVPRVFEDYSLADYDQFVELLRVLDGAPRDVMVLSGDVHFSRAASLILPNGRQIVEIINSPLALVVGLGRSKMQDARGFAKIPGAGAISAAQVKTDASFKSVADSAVALSIYRSGLKVHVKAELWCVEKSPGAARPVCQYDIDLL